MDLGLSGLASGFDWRSLVDKLADVERTPQKRLRFEQSTLQTRNNAFGSIKTQLTVLKNRCTASREIVGRMSNDGGLIRGGGAVVPGAKRG